VRPAPAINPFEEDGVETMLQLLAASPTLRRSKGISSRVRGVGVMDAVHVQAARHLRATHFLTTDRCLAAIDSEMEMMLVGSYPEPGSSMIRPAFLDIGRRPHMNSGDPAGPILQCCASS
jgi:hypothetical protein